MLVNLTYDKNNISPSSIVSMIAQINAVDVSKPEEYFEHYTTGVYRHDGYLFNSDLFIDEHCSEIVVDKWVGYGVCDNYHQVLETYRDLLSLPTQKFVIMLSTVTRASQPERGGWRWHKWGEYIGTQNPQHEYLYDDTHIDKVYCFSIYEVE